MQEKNMKILKWILVFSLFFVGLFCYMKDYGYCSEYQFGEHVPVEKEYLFQHYECKGAYTIREEYRPHPSYNQRQKWQDAYDNHHFNAVRTYTDAYNRVWLLPNLTWRQIGRDCWVSACAMASTKSPSAALVVAFSTLLSQYGLHCLDEWDYIQDKLYWSQYHFEQCAYYSNLLSK